MKKPKPNKLEVVKRTDKNGFKYWEFKDIPKELIPTSEHEGRLVIVAKELGSREKYSGYRVKKVDTEKKIVELMGPEGFRSFSLQSVALSTKKLTPEEKLINEHEKKNK